MGSQKAPGATKCSWRHLPPAERLKVRALASAGLVEVRVGRNGMAFRTTEKGLADLQVLFDEAERRKKADDRKVWLMLTAAAVVVLVVGLIVGGLA